MKRDAATKRSLAVWLIIVFSISGCAAAPKPAEFASELAYKLTLGVLENALENVVHGDETPEERRRRKLIQRDLDRQRGLRSMDR